MLSLLLSGLLLAAETFAQSSSNTTSNKRGLVYVPSKKYPSDDKIWTQAGSDLTWYYNYGAYPSDSFKNTQLEFVPMLFGAPNDPKSTDTTFLDSITALLKQGVKIKYVLSYNEPDGGTSTGGSNLPVDTAASTWMRNLKPLRNRFNISLGLPAVTGSPNGFSWLKNFNASCQLLDPAGCKADFVPVHWYGNFGGLASHVGEVMATYPDLPVWVTEYNLDNANLADSQQFYNQSSSYFDRLPNLDRYSMFASFRSDVSNVGPYATFLNQDGQLTDIGSWYLGGTATGHKSNGKKSSGANELKMPGSMVAVVAALALLVGY